MDTEPPLDIYKWKIQLSPHPAGLPLHKLQVTLLKRIGTSNHGFRSVILSTLLNGEDPYLWENVAAAEKVIRFSMLGPEERIVEELEDTERGLKKMILLSQKIMHQKRDYWSCRVEELEQVSIDYLSGRE